MLERRKLLAGIAGSLAAASLVAAGAMPAMAQETIKVGILHSLSGTMAISETTLKDVMLMLIEEQNKKGGLLGRQEDGGRLDHQRRCQRAVLQRARQRWREGNRHSRRRVFGR